MPGKWDDPVYRQVAGGLSTFAANLIRSKMGTHKEEGPDGPRVVQTEVGEYSKYRRRLGRYKRRTLRHAYKILRSLNQDQYYRWQGINGFGKGGFYTLFNATDTGGLVTYLPMRTFELTQIPNEGTFANTPFLEWRAPSTGLVSSGGYSNVALNHPNESNVLQSTWITENAESVSAGRMATYKYMDLKMMLYGTQNFSVEYEIAIVSFPDELYNPFFATSPSLTEKDNMLQYLTQPFSFTPLYRGDPLLARKIKFHYRKRFIIQGAENTEKDSLPHYKKVEIFKKWDKMYHFDWDRTVTNATETWQSTTTAPVANVQFDKSLSIVHPKARMYLLIRCLLPQRNSAGVPAFTNNTDASFDLFIRNKWEFTSM